MIPLLTSIAAALNREPAVDAVYFAAFLSGFLPIYLPGCWFVDKYLGPSKARECSC